MEGAQVDVRSTMLRVDRECLAIMFGRFVGIALLAERDGPVVVRLRLVRVEFDRSTILRDRFVGSAEGLKGHSQASVSRGPIGIDPNRSAITVHGCRPVLLCALGVAQMERAFASGG